MITTSSYRASLAAVALGGLVGWMTMLAAPASAADAKGNTIQPGQMRASKMIGNNVYGTNDQALGQVVDIVLDPDGEVAAVVIGVTPTAGEPRKNVAVPMRDIKREHDRLSLSRTQAQLQQADNYRLNGGATGSGTSTPPTQDGHTAPHPGGNSPSGK